MADQLQLQTEKKKKGPGLILDPNPVPLQPTTQPLPDTRPLPGAPPKAKRPWGQGWHGQLQLSHDPVPVERFDNLTFGEQRARSIEIGEAKIAEDIQAGRYSTMGNDEKDRYLDAKYGEVWTDDFWMKTKRGVGTALEMLGEDLVVGLFYSGPKELSRMAGEDAAFDYWLKNAQSAVLDPRYLKLVQPATRESLRKFGYQRGGLGVLEQALRNIQIEEQVALYRMEKNLSLDPAMQVGQRAKDLHQEKLAPYIKKINEESIRKANEALPEELKKELKRLKVKSVSTLFNRDYKPGFAFFSKHSMGLRVKAAGTVAEAFLRGGTDIGMIVHMVANNMFDLSAHHQSAANKHMNVHLKQYWKERGKEYSRISLSDKPDLDNVPGKLVSKWRDEIPETYDKLKEIRRDQWDFMQIMTTDREIARTGGDPLISKWLRNSKNDSFTFGLTAKNIDSLADAFRDNISPKGAEALSYGLDPITIGTAGLGLAAKPGTTAARVGLTRTAASGALKKGGELVEKGGEFLARSAAKLDETVGEGVLGAAGGAVVAATTDAPLVTSVVVGAAGGKVVQPTAKLASLGEFIKDVGRTGKATGEIISTHPGSEGFMRRLSMSSTAPERVATVASALEFADPLINLGASTIKGSATGAAIGGGIGLATGEGTEFTAAAVAVGTSLGGMTALPMHLVTASTKAKLQSDVGIWIARQPENVREYLASRPFEDQAKMAELDILVKGYGAYEGRGDISVEYIYAPKKKHNGAWLGDEGRIVVNLAYEGARGMFHEVGHAMKALAKGDSEGSKLRQAYEDLTSILYDREVGGTVLKGYYSIDDEIAFAKQYHERIKKSLSGEELNIWEKDNGFKFKTAELTKEHYLASEEARNLTRSEIEADAFMLFIEGSKPGATFRAAAKGGLGKPKQRLLNHIMLSQHSRTMTRLRWGLELFGVKFDGDGKVNSMFQKDGKGVTNSPEVNAAISQLIAARKAIRKQVVPEVGEVGGNVFSMEEVRANPGLVKYFGAHDSFARGKDGEILHVDGKPVMLPNRQVRKLQRERMKAMVSALEGVDETGGLVMAVNDKGKKRWSGKNFSKEQVDALLALPDDVFSPRLKDNLRFIYDRIKNGDSLHIDYNARIRGGKYSSEISAAWRHEMPFAVEITQAGNFLVKGVNVDRINSRIAKWKRDKKGRYLDLWESDNKFYADLMQYMSNHRKGLPGRTGLHADEAIAAARAHRINELFYVHGSEEARPTTVGGKPARVVSSLRFDGMNQAKTGSGEWSADYGLLKRSYMPAGEPKLGGKKGSLVPKKDRVKTGHPPRVKPLEEAARRVDKMTDKEWAKEIEKHSPIRPVPDDRVPNKAELNLMDDISKGFLNKTQQENFRNPVHGDKIEKARIDITAFKESSKAGTPVHPVAFNDSKGRGYSGYLVLDNAKFTYGSSERSLKIAQGMEKEPLAFVAGTANTRNIPTRTELLRTNKAGERVWTQAGFNPTKHGYFFDKHNPSMKVIGGDRALMAGSTVWVRNAKTVKAVKTPGLMRMGEGPEVRYMPAGKGIEVAPGLVRAKVDSEFKLSKPVLSQYMPAGKHVNIMDYADRPMFTLAADNLVTGIDPKVGPTGGKMPIGVEAQGGRGFQFLNPKEMIWAFKGRGTAVTLQKRGLEVSGGENTVIVGVTSQGTSTHFNSPYGLYGFAKSLEAAANSKTFPQRRVDQHIKDLMTLVARTSDDKFTTGQRNVISNIKGLASLLRAVTPTRANPQGKIGFHAAGIIKEKFKQIGKLKKAKLEIIQPELEAAGLHLKELMHDLSDPGLRDAKIGDVVALVELDLTKAPKKTDFHFSYPWTIEGKPIGFLKKFPNVRDLTSDTRIYTKRTGQMTSQPLQTVMPEFNRLKSGEVSYMPAGRDASPGWTSNVTKALGKIQKANPDMKSMKGPTMYNRLKDLGALEEEVKWIEDLDTGEALDTWLKRQDKVTPQQVKDFIAKNQVEVLERTYGGKDSEALQKADDRVEEAQMTMWEADDRGTLAEYREAEADYVEARDEFQSLLKEEGTKYDKSDLVLPGAKKGSYRELVLRVPSPKRAPEVTVKAIPIIGSPPAPDFNPSSTAVPTKRFFVDISNLTTFDYHSVKDLASKRYATRAEAEVEAVKVRNLALKKIPTGKEFTSKHFKDDPNVILHLRMNERVDADGKRMLFIEELQSDWAAKGRDKGFKQSETVAETQKLAHADRERFYSGKGNMPDAEWNALSERVRQWDKREAAAKDAIPAAPFVAKLNKEGTMVGSKKWKSLGMKRAIRWAAENGYDRLGWISGKDTAERYNLRKHIETLEYDRLDKGFTRITAVDKDGNKLINDRRFPNENLDEAVGKEMADRILSQEKDMGEFSGMDLEVGGEGHIQMYDIDLPNMVKKYGKKWGAKVGKVGIGELAWLRPSRMGLLKSAHSSAHYIDITPAMKESVMTEGQTMFMPKGKDGKVKPRKGSATARKTGTRIPMGAVAKQLRLERDLKKLKRN